MEFLDLLSHACHLKWQGRSNILPSKIDNSLRETENTAENNSEHKELQFCFIDTPSDTIQSQVMHRQFLRELRECCDCYEGMRS